MLERSDALNRPLDTPCRVLHVASMLRSGGVERWLVDLCVAGSAQNLPMDIAVIVETGGIFTDVARERNIRILPCPPQGKPLAFMWNLSRLISEYGPYDAIHAHVHAFSGFAVALGWLMGIPARIVHSHNVVRNASESFYRRIYYKLGRTLIRAFATAAIAPASPAAQDMLGPNWRRNPRWRVMPCGIDLVPFRYPADGVALRAELGIPPDAIVLASVGRLTAEKNTEFLIDMLGAVLPRLSRAHLLLIGEGDLRERLYAKALSAGFGDRLHLPGTRTDVPAVLRSVVDVFVFPSPPPPRGNEALPIAVIEAQVCGLKCVVSDGIPPEAIIIPELTIQIPAAAGAEAWAEAVAAQVARGDLGLADDAFGIMQGSSFNVVNNVLALGELYRRPGN